MLILPNSSTNTNVTDEESTGGEDGPQSLDNRPDRAQGEVNDTNG